MFGESDSESPRVPSPWDTLTSASPTPPRIPRLIPEVEEGNFEYKLQLLAPSPGRFARLVTQLKWRLLEGGGQAYYEIGVADSGALVGLSRQELEESLETLEMMAGEIGASVIVVKEIEVSPALSGLAQTQLERWERRRRTRKDVHRAIHDVDSSSATSATEPETEASVADITDPEDTLGAPFDMTRVQHPDTPVVIFMMDANNDPPEEVDGTNGLLRETATLSMDLEISSVYKPRPMRKRAKHSASMALMRNDKQGKHLTGKKGLQDKAATTDTTGDEDIQDRISAHSVKTGNRKQTRERRRGPKNDLTHMPTNQHRIASHDLDPVVTTHVTNDTNTLVSSFTVDPLTYPSASSPQMTSQSGNCGDTEKDAGHSVNEPRLIVEVLVVRKMSLEDSFLDFGGFAFG
ncbi:hypothetical protein J3A83DRAFT_956481 [Scleroderma citrinum]